jgi:hypothetical protein
LIEWVYHTDGGYVGNVVETAYTKDELVELKELAGIMQHEYNQEFYNHFG